MSWQAIWNEARVFQRPPVNVTGPLRNLSLWLEITGPRLSRAGLGRLTRAPKPLRLWRGIAGHNAGGLEIFLMPDGAVRLVQADIDLCSDPGLLRPGETIGLRYVTCAEGRDDVLDITNFDQGRKQAMRAGLPHVATLAEALPADRGYLRVAHIAAIASSKVPASDLPGIESGAIIATPQGPRPIDSLRVGDPVLDEQGQPHPLRWIEPRTRLCLGRTAPIRLRSPYFGLARDVVVTPQTRLLQSGAIVDYLCGTEAVLAQAVDLTTGRAILPDRNRPVRQFWHLMLDDPACILVENCPVETAHLGDVVALGAQGGQAMAEPDEADRKPSLPLIDRATARALVTAHARAA